jgi:hypothetical protein
MEFVCPLIAIMKMKMQRTMDGSEQALKQLKSELEK